MINTSIEPVTFPLSIDSWNSFNDIGIYHIDYSKSNYKGKKFLIYAFNIGPSIIIENITTSEIRQLSQDYVTFKRLISINSINDVIIDTIINNQRNEISDMFYQKIGIVLYSIYCYAKEMVSGNTIEYPKNEISIEPLSTNVISLIKSPRYWDLITIMESSNISPIYFKEFFDNSYFCGLSIVDLFLEEFNPISIIYMMNAGKIERCYDE